MFLNLFLYEEMCRNLSNTKKNYFSQDLAFVDQVNTVSVLQQKREVVENTLLNRKILNSKLIEFRGHLGHLVFRWNPRMLKYIYTISTRRGQKRHIINTVKTSKEMIKAFHFLRDVGKKDGEFLFVGTKPVVSKLIEQKARKMNSPFINNRWLGGILTNWSSLQTSIKSLANLSELDSKDLKSKAAAKRIRRLLNLNKKVGGLSNMKSLPDVVIIVGALQEKKAIAECRKLGIKIVSTVDTNSDPTGVDYPIPVNEDSIEAIEFILDFLTKAIEEGRGSTPLGEKEEVLSNKDKKRKI
jgi:small subunit ribosomal protein S2